MRKIVATIVLLVLASEASSQERPGICSALQNILPTSPSKEFVGPTIPDDANLLKSFLAHGGQPYGGRTRKPIELLTASEVEDLTKQIRDVSLVDFEPVCDWAKRAAPVGADVRHFTRPVFSSDGHLFAVAVSVVATPLMGGSGYICVARQTNGAWVSKCAGSWIS